MPSLTELVAEREILLCTGPGGVGKTTTSAAIGLMAAAQGRKVAVLTIDPARRLADALGVALDNQPRQIDPSVFAAAGLNVPGELWALMLDAAHTFDDLIQRLAPDRDTARRILHNVVYTQMSRALAGTLEYMAVEKLFDLRSRHGFDLVVVDTPPSKNVLDFVEAPEWLTRFLDERVLRWFVMFHPEAQTHGVKEALLKRTSKMVFDVLARVMGREFLNEVIGFMVAIEGMAAEFRRRAQDIQALLRSSRASFLVVATSDPFVLRDAAYLRNEILQRGIPFGGFVVNRVHDLRDMPEIAHATAVIRAASATDPSADNLIDKLARVSDELGRRATEDRNAIAMLRVEARWQGYIGELPLLGEEVTDLTGLAQLARRLGGTIETVEAP